MWGMTHRWVFLELSFSELIQLERDPHKQWSPSPSTIPKSFICLFRIINVCICFNFLSSTDRPGDETKRNEIKNRLLASEPTRPKRCINGSIPRTQCTLRARIEITRSTHRLLEMHNASESDLFAFTSFTIGALSMPQYL